MSLVLVGHVLLMTPMRSAGIGKHRSPLSRRRRRAVHSAFACNNPRSYLWGPLWGEVARD